MMNIEKNIDISRYSTMGLVSKSQEFTIVKDVVQLQEVVDYATSNLLKVHVLGGGSNTIFKDGEFKGMIIKNEITGFDLTEQGLLTAGAGEDWDDIVSRAVADNWSGIETLSLIPGTVGAAPVQNIGAYGQELSDCFIELKALEISTNQFRTFSKEECMFGYRSSRFKLNPGNYIITEIKLQLNKNHLKSPFYTTLQKHLDKNKITDYSPSTIRSAVVDWRSNYLPNVAEVKTAGSFFTNPIISKEVLDNLITKNPQLAEWPTKWYWPQADGKCKIAAGGLAEIAGLKDWHDEETGMATWKNSALVLVNKSAKSYEDLDSFRQKYLAKIESAYGLKFDQEPVEV